MKSIYLLTIFLIISQFISAQVYHGKETEKFAKNADMVRISEMSKIPSFIKFEKTFKINEINAIDYTEELIGSNRIDFTFQNTVRSKSNSFSSRYTPTIDGYPIEFSSWIIHVKDGNVTSMNGSIPDNLPQNIIFNITEEEALKVALNYMGAESYMWEDKGMEDLLKQIKNDENATYYPKGEKVIAPNKITFIDSELKPTYKFNIYSSKPLDRKMVYVDAQTGQVLFDLSLIHFSEKSDKEDDDPEIPTDVIGTAHTVYKIGRAHV